MTITLQRLATTGETAYIAKHNANYDTLESSVNTLQGTVYTLQQASASPGNLFNIGKAMFGPTAVAVIGETSFASSTSGTNLTLQPGFYWNASSALMAYKATTTVIPFSGATAGTYYVRMGIDGIPYRDTSSAAALYSVVWTGSAFGTVAKLASYAPGYQDLLDLLSSSYSGLSYASPDKRIEATEKAFSALLSKAITTADVTLTATEALEQGVIRLTGTPTAARNLIVPAKAKVYFIDNDTAGAFAVTVKTASGTGVALASGTNGALFCDGTNVVSIATAAGSGGASVFTDLTDVPASYAGQANKVVKVKADESGLEYSSAAAPTVFTGLTDAPASYTGQAGKVPIVNVGETALVFGDPVSTYLALTDTPASYAGQAYRVVSVKGDESGLEFTAAAAPSTLLALTDTPDSYAASALMVLRVNAAGTAVEFAAGTGPQNFLELPDTPANYTSSALKFVRVNAAMTALEFAPLTMTTLLGLTDTPDSYAGSAFKVVTVKGDESGIEFSAGATPTSFIGLTDAPTSYTGQGSKTVKVKSDASGLEFVTVPAGITAFTGLSDAPANYTGAANMKVKVNSAGTGLEFVTDTAGVTAFTGLSDAPANYTGAATYKVRVNSAGTALEFVADTRAFTSLTDVPANYTGAANKKVRVNSAGTGLEFVTDTTGATAFTGLSDVPANYTGAALKKVRVNSGATALEFVDEPFAANCTWNGVTTASLVLIHLPMPVAVTFAAAFAGSYGVATTAATAQTDFDIKKNGTSVGTLRFAAAATTATFIAASPVSFAAGDVLKLVGPATPDATLATLGLTLKGVR
jgi:hypothetical protein